MAELWSVLVILFSTVIGAFGSLFFKMGSETLSLNIGNLLRNYKLMLGFMFYGVASIMFIIALQGGELSVLYPLVAMAYVWICMLSVKVLNERMNFLKWLGVFLIVVGVSLIGSGS